MKRFITFLLEAKSPEELARIKQAKVDSYVGKYMKHHKDHPTVRANPEEAKKLIAASMPLQSSHEEAIYASRNFLDGTLKPGEDDDAIRHGINRYRSAKKRGKFKDSLESHTHDSLMAALKTADPQKDTDILSIPGPKMDDLDHLKIGQIYHPEHGPLKVYQIHKDNVKDMTQFGELSKRFKQQACVNNNFCTFREQHGDVHLKHYSHGHGMLYYVNKNNRIVFGHGFGDRGIVNPNNTIVSNDEANIIQKQTSKLLQGKHKEVYDSMFDPEKSKSYEHQKKIFDEFGKSHGIAHFLSPSTNTHPKLLEDILASGHRNNINMSYIFNHPNASTNMISKALNDENNNIRFNAIHSRNANPEHITKALNDTIPYIREAAIQHPKATPEHISRALNDSDDGVRGTAIHHPNANPEHITKALNDTNPYIRAYAIQHPNVTPEHISHALNHKDYDIRRLAIQHPNANPEHITKALNDTIPFIREAAIRHPKATPEHITKALKDSYHDVRAAAIGHPKATPEHISRALNDSNDDIREKAIRHPNANPENISQALDNENFYITSSAIGHPNVTPEHITKALNHKDYDIRHLAIQHPNANPENISQALNDKRPSVRIAAMRHPNVTPEHITKALKDSYHDVRAAAIGHSRATLEHITQALNDESPYVRSEAIRIQAKRQQNQVHESLFMAINKLLLN